MPSQAYWRQMADQTGAEEMVSQTWLRAALASGRALAICKAAGVTCAEVAEYCGVTAPTAWCWLNGHIRRPQRDHALKLARLLEHLATVSREY